MWTFWGFDAIFEIKSLAIFWDDATERCLAEAETENLWRWMHSDIDIKDNVIGRLILSPTYNLLINST